MNFHTKVVGVTFEGRQRILARLRVGESLKLMRDPNNQYDSNAIKVMTLNGDQAGFISKELTKDMAWKMDNGHKYRCTVSSVTGGNIGQSYGVNIFVEEV